jgi:hypothetical protein
MARKFMNWTLGLGLASAVLLAADAAQGGGGTSFGIGFGGGGGGMFGGIGYSDGYRGGGYHGGGYHGGGYSGGSSVRWGVNVPLSSDGNVRLGVGSGGYYPSGGYYRDRDYPYRGYDNGGDYYYRGSDQYSTPRGVRYVESAPQEPPPPPTAGQASRMSDAQLAELLRAACEDYGQELDGYTNGETWQKYFKLAEILDALKKSKPGALDAARTSLAEIGQRMDAAAKNPEYVAVTKGWGFKTLQVCLREYALPPAERAAHVLSADLQIFSRALDGVTTGDGWKKHLQIEELGKLVEKPGGNGAASEKQLEKILAKFDAVAQNSQYRAIAEMDRFAAARTGLQRYIGALQTERSVPAPPPPALDAPQAF